MRHLALCSVLAALAAAAGAVHAQEDRYADKAMKQIEPRRPGAPSYTPDDPPFRGAQEAETGEGGGADALVHVPVTTLYPGMVKPKPNVKSPVMEDEEAAWRGKGYFNQFNCVGCHAPHGAGGMGPSLSDAAFIYGNEPANIYLTIVQGRPAGMPAFGGMLPDSVVWDLVAYVKALSKNETGDWGKTVSLRDYTIEQVPAQYVDTVDPWSRTQPFSFGQPPFRKLGDDPSKGERLEARPEAE